MKKKNASIPMNQMALLSPSCVVVVLSPEFEPSVNGAVVGELFPVVACVVVSRSSGSLVGVVVLGVVTAVVVVVVAVVVVITDVLTGGSVAGVELVRTGVSCSTSVVLPDVSGATLWGTVVVAITN